VIIFDVEKIIQNKIKENPVVTESRSLTGADVENQDFSEYVAYLQLHMTLQARNLVPTLKQTLEDSRQQLLHQTQAHFEKLASRQGL
jgi:hypothetical protein